MAKVTVSEWDKQAFVEAYGGTRGVLLPSGITPARQGSRSQGQDSVPPEWTDQITREAIEAFASRLVRSGSFTIPDEED